MRWEVAKTNNNSTQFLKVSFKKGPIFGSQGVAGGSQGGSQGRHPPWSTISPPWHMCMGDGGQTLGWKRLAS